MRIVIDMQGAQTEGRYRGIGRYVTSFAQAVARNRGAHEVLLALNHSFPASIEPIRMDFDAILSQDDIRVWQAPGPVRKADVANTARRARAETLREAFLASLAPDLVHIGSMFEGYHDDAVVSVGRLDQTVATSAAFYDLIPLLNPAHYLDPDPNYKDYYLENVGYLRKTSALLAISEFAKQEGIAHLGVPAERFVNVSTATEPRFKPVAIDSGRKARLLEKFGLTKPFVLYTGGADERKNLARLIQAFAGLPLHLRKSHQLLLVGKIDEPIVVQLRHVAQQAGLAPAALRFSGYVTEDELVAIYNLCRLYVFPSWHEGFGLPALEAMSCGAPVVGASTSSLPEVIGLQAALFDPLDVAAISEKIAQGLSDEDFRTLLREHGLKQAKLFSWDETAKTAIATWESTVKPGKRSSRLKDDHRSLKPVIHAIAQADSSLPADHEIVELAKAIAASFPSNASSKRLFLDVSVTCRVDQKTGIQRVARSLLLTLLRFPPPGYQVEPVYLCNDSGRWHYRFARAYGAELLGSQGSSESKDDVVEPEPGDVIVGLDLSGAMLIGATQEGLLVDYRNRGVKVYSLVFDLLPLSLPDLFPITIQQQHGHWLKSVSELDGAICISKAVADELSAWQAQENLDFRQRRPFRIEVLHLGADIDNSFPTWGLPDDAVKTLDALQDQTNFLMVGTVEPRKGHAQTLAAFDRLWDQGKEVNLVIVGRQGWQVESLVEKMRSHDQLGRRLFWLEGISDEYLTKVYSLATCLIAASEGEGFGLPLIEAAQHKLPIIARDLPVFVEVAGKHAFYFKGKDPASLADTISEWCRRYEKKQHADSLGLPWLTWKQCAENLSRQVLPQGR